MTDRSNATPDGEAITPEGLEAVKAELGELETVGRREIAKRILTAREHGDLSENAEYHAAKEDQAHLETRIKRLRGRLRNAVVVERNTEDVVFSFGRTAEIVDEDTGEVHTWTWSEPQRPIGRPASFRLSRPSPRRSWATLPGEVVEVPTPRGRSRLRIQRLARTRGRPAYIKRPRPR